MPTGESQSSTRAFDLLVVDDDIGQVQLLQVLMKELGLPHRCHHAPDGKKALDFLHRRPPYENVPRPDLILLDLNMPGMNGHEVVRTIKSSPDLRTIPVIILSSSRNQADVDESYREGANAYINKPSDLESNLRTIQGIDRFWAQVVRLPD
jgi:CheY-like chemotaxis protein